MLPRTRVTDPEVYAIVADELDRQQHNIEMIASESTAPLEVLELSGSVFTNKTTEGYPGARFQAGSQVADRIESLAIARAKALFGAEHANLQPYSGSTANYGVYAAVLQPGDLVFGMRLDQGGHLTHGSKANFTSKFYRFMAYGVDPVTECIDYNALHALAKAHRPKLIVAGGSSYPRLIDYPRMAAIAEEVGALLMVDMAHIAGLVAAKVIPSPVPHADFVSSSTTKTFCGPRSGLILCKAEHAKALDKGVFPGSLGSIHLTTIAAKAFSLGYAATPAFRAIMEQVLVNARTLAEELSRRGFRIVSGGTDNHLLLVDLRPRGISGKAFQDALEGVGITVNKNMIPFDPAKPSETSGVRIGLTSISQRGLKEPEVVRIAAIMDKVATNLDNKAALAALGDEARELITPFPLYPAGSFAC